MNKYELIFYIDKAILVLSLICIWWIIEGCVEFWFEETKRKKEWEDDLYG